MTDSVRFRTILLFGMPGSGKGTQGAVLGQLPEFVHVSCGDVFRKLNKSGPLGMELLHYTSQGLLVPDDLTIRIWKRHIQILEMQDLFLTTKHALILDGIPRTYHQADLMDSMLDVIQVFHLRIDDEHKAIERIKARALRENRLDDSNVDVIRRRLEAYYEETYETLSFYDPHLVTNIDADQTPLLVLRDIVSRLGEIYSKDKAKVAKTPA